MNNKLTNLKNRKSPSERVNERLQKERETKYLDSIRGPKGDTGPMGPTGPKGDKGDKPIEGIDYVVIHGKDGKDGRNGTQGVDGDSGIDAVILSSSTITYTDGLVTSIAYADGQSKTFTYNVDDTVDTMVWDRIVETVTKQFSYNVDGTVSTITVTIG